MAREIKLNQCSLSNVLIRAALTLLVLTAAPVVAADFVVNNDGDEPDAHPGDGFCRTAAGACSLRAALDEARYDDLITFAAAYEIVVESPLVVQNRFVTIQGLGTSTSTGTRVDGNGRLPIFVLLEPTTSVTHLVLRDLRVQNGRRNITADTGTRLDLDGCVVTGGSHQYDGGGIYAETATVNIVDSEISNNTAGGRGGGIFWLSDDTRRGLGITGNSAVISNTAGGDGGGVCAPGFGTVVIENSRVGGNTSYGSGGGIELGTDLDMYRSRVLGNSAALDGGGIHAFRDSVTLEESTVIDNEAAENGGGLYLAGNQTDELSHLVNSTVTGNTADGSGGGLYLDTSDLSCKGLTLDNVTVTGNVADADDDNDGNAGGLYRDGTFSSLEMQNTILAGNVDASTGTFALVQRDCRATLDSLGYNVIGTVQAGCTIDGTTRGNVTGTLASPVDPLLGAANPGNLLPVHVPQNGSPAVDGGNPLGCTAWSGRLLYNDEIGDPRPAGSACDVGAVESPHAEPPMLTVEVTGTADGTVTSSPVGISCPGDCTQEYGSVTAVTLTATPVDPQDSFAGWSGDPECLDGKVTMNRHMLCIATFEAAPTYSFQLTILGTGDGSVHVLPFNFQVTTTFGATVDEGETITMTPWTDLGSQFMGFGGDADCTDGSVTISGDVECTATFDAMPDRSFTLNVIGSGKGSVNVTPPDVDVTTTYTTTYPHGQTVTMTPTADPGSFFAVFSGDVDCSDGELTITEDLVCTATFDPTGGLIFQNGFEGGSLPGGWSNVAP